jgi:MFS family permease
LFWRQPGTGLWLIYVVAFAEMTLSQFFAPARSALLPRLIAKDDLIQANSLSATSEALTRLVGPSLGGALLGLAGFGSVVLVDAGTYFLSALLIYGIAVPKNISQEPEEVAATKKPSPFQSLWQDWKEGLRLVMAQRSLRGLFLVSAAIFLGQGIISVLLIVFVKDVLHGGALQFGWMATAQGVGTLVGGLLIGHISRQVGPRNLILAGTLSAGLLFLIVIYSASLPVALVLLAVIGVPVVGLIVSIQTLLQTSVDDSFRGRIFGTYSATVALVMMIGMGAAGTMGDWLGVLPMLSVGSGLFIAAGFVALITIPQS